MAETEATETIEATEETETIEATEATEEFDMQRLYEIMSIARGIDPKQQQAMSKFSDFDNQDERTYYPNRKTALAIAQLRMYGSALYKDDEWNEYDDIADDIAIAFMGLKGFKSDQYKDITSGQPNLEKLQGLPEETRKGVLSGIWNRGRSE